MDLKDAIWILANWLNLMLLVTAKLTCRFEDNTHMFHSCNATGFELNTLHRGLVSDKRTTFHIILKQCQISSIDVEAFYRLPALVILDLEENKIAKLEEGVFDRVPKLSRLILSNNLLTELPPGIFNNVPELSVLDLRGNKLSFRHSTIFDALPRLDQLHLSYNLFIGKDFEADFLSKNQRLSVLSLSGNDMVEASFLSKMQNVNYLYMDNCILTDVPKFVVDTNMRHLRHLSLSGNKLTKITNMVFKNLVNVETLNLSKNDIEVIDGNTFELLTSLQTLDLSHNRITIIPAIMFQNKRYLLVLNLSFNLIMDVPIIAFSNTALKRLNLSNNKITYLTDNFLVHLEDTGVMLKMLDIGGNPWQCACLRDLLRELKELDVTYDGSSFDGSHSVCVTKDTFVCKRDQATSIEFINIYEQIK